ncbi:uncharacterized protein LOC144158566 isoform X4 [Haemaphysalis longicornis]
MPMGCIMAVSTDVSCSQETQATVSACAIGTQCALVSLTCVGCQTYEDFPVLEVGNLKPGALKRFPEGAVLDTCSCHLHLSNEGVPMSSPQACSSL